MNVLNICRWDFGGCAIRLTDAINQHTKHVARHLSTNTQPFGYKKDIFTGNVKEINKWINWADIVNCWGSTRPIIYTKGKIKNLIITYVGSHFRNKPHARHIQAESLGAKKELGAGSWMCNYGDLNLEWLPAALPVDDWLKLKRGHKGKPIICQSPSNFRMKQTNRIMELLSNKNNITLKIISGLTWDKCMAAKADADIYVGPFKLGYGISLLEAMTMKIPVITHAKFEKEIIEKVGYLPFYSCKLEELPNAIDTLLSDKKLYNKYAMLGFNYVKKFHDYPIVADKFVNICEKIL